MTLPRSTAFLGVVSLLCGALLGFAGTSEAGSDLPLDGKAAQAQSLNDLFGSGSPGEGETPATDIDKRYLSQSLVEGRSYKRMVKLSFEGQFSDSQVYKASATGQRLELNTWDSHILFNDGLFVVELRRYAETHATTLFTEAGFSVPGLESVNDWLDETTEACKTRVQRMQADNSSPTLLSVVRRLCASSEFIDFYTGEHWEGTQAATEAVKLHARGIHAHLEPTLFSAAEYIILYKLGSTRPSEVVRVRPRLATTSASVDSVPNIAYELYHLHQMGDDERMQEDARVAAIKRTAFALDEGLLPKGEPPRVGDRWEVDASVLGQVLGMSTSTRIAILNGRLYMLRGSDVKWDGLDRPAAQLALDKNETNHVHVEMEPIRKDAGYLETDVFTMAPDSAFAYWAFDKSERQIVEATVTGRAHFRRYADVSWWPDREISGTPYFQIRYTSERAPTDFYRTFSNIVDQILPVLEQLPSVPANVVAKIRNKRSIR